MRERNERVQTRVQTRDWRSEERNSQRIPYSHLSLFSRLSINFAIINCEDIINSRLDGSSRRGRDNEGEGRFKMRQEFARGREGGRRLRRDTAKVTEAAIMKGELITPTRQYYTDSTPLRGRRLCI